MASLTKRPNSQFWIACFTDRSGRRLKRSTKATDRKRAQKIADEWEGAFRIKRTALQFRRILTEGHREISGGDVAHLTVRDFIDGWVEGKDSLWPVHRSAVVRHSTSDAGQFGLAAERVAIGH